MSTPATATALPSTNVQARGIASPAFLLFTLTLFGTVNWADRQVVSALGPDIQRDLGLSLTQLGVLTGYAFTTIYAISSLFFGYAADRLVRKYVMFGALVVWSLATMASGLATSFWPLFFARFFTGIGEACLYPCALSLIAERFPAEARGRALGIFGAAAAMGGGLGIGVGGKLSQSVGWQNVFFIYGAMGFVVLPLLLLLREARRSGTAAHAESTKTAVRAALGDRRLLWLWACGTLAIACGQGFGQWVFFYFVRVLGMGADKAGAFVGVANLVGGIFGGLVGGALADKQRKKRVGGEFDIAAGAAFVGAVFVFATLEAGPGIGAAVGGLIATFAIYALFPPLLSAMLSMVPPHRHGATGAINTLCLGGIGAGLGPTVIGFASDRLGSLHMALYIPMAGLAVAGFLAMQAGKVARDNAPHSPQSSASAPSG
jgi:MFS transporter, Spinster family, sphingosine-1-phosphate transporter